MRFVHYKVKCNECKKNFNCVREDKYDCSVEDRKEEGCICPKCWAKRGRDNMGCYFLKDVKKRKEKVIFT